MPGRHTTRKWLMDIAKVIVGVGLIALLTTAGFGKHSDPLAAFTDSVAARSSGMSEEALMVKCESLLDQKRAAEAYDVASRGCRAFGGSEWRYLYGETCALRYEQTRDRAYLEQAERLFRAYVREVPYDTSGHNQLGWCLSHLGRRPEAKREFLKALSLDPGDRMARDKLQYVQ